MIKVKVGFDQKISRYHLDFTANEVRKFTRKEMYEVLDYYLREDIKGTRSRQNSITLLMKIWYLIPDNIVSLRNKALELFPDLTRDERLCLHWGMTILAYPFFKDQIYKMGNLFRLQDEIPSTVIGKKMKELYGDRRRVEVATSAVLMSIKSWEVVEMKKSRSYILPQKIQINNSALHSFIVEVIIRAIDVKSVPLDLLQNHTLFFPFQYEISAGELRKSNVFRLDRQGVDMLMIELTS